MYSTKVIRAEDTHGKVIFLASHPELKGCIAQGSSVKEALDNLKDATFEFISSLREDGLPIPEPNITELSIYGFETIDCANP